MRTGSSWEPNTYELGPGEEAQYIIQMNTGRKNWSKDWALTAWGYNGEVSVTINGKDRSEWSGYIESESESVDNGGDNSDPVDEVDCSPFSTAAANALTNIECIG